jgi:hypothetical protein
MENRGLSLIQSKLPQKALKMGVLNPKVYMRTKQFVLLFLLALFVSTCKKGEDDPLFSLSSRKARMEGEWRFVSGDLVIGTTDLKNWTRYNEVFVFKGSGYEMTQTGAINPIVSKGTFILSLTIKKDGHFSVEEIFDGKILEAEGNWDFNTGIGSEKSKSEISFEITNVSKGVTGGYHLLNQSGTKFSYKIKELRNKRLVLKIDRLIYEDINGPKQTFYGEFVFVQ